MENKGTKQTHYMYDAVKVKQLEFSVHKMCVKRGNNKSAKDNALRSLYLDIGPETASDTPESREASSGDQVSPEKVEVGHVDSAEASNVAIQVLPSDTEDVQQADLAKDNAVMVLDDETEPKAPAPDEEFTEGEDAALQMTNQEADLAADLAADEEIEVIESDIGVAVCVPGALCAAPVPDAIAAAERAPLLEHAKQRKAKATQMI